MNEIYGEEFSHIKNPKYYIQTGLYNGAEMKVPVNYMIDKPKYIDYYTANQKEAKKNISFSYNNAFVISKIDSHNKYSKNYLNCTGVIAIGEEKDSGDNLSFLTHQNIISYMKNKEGVSELFKEKLKQSLNKLKELSKKGTIDIVILGGNDLNDFKDYKETIKFLSDIISEEMGFYPSVVGGPTINDIVGKKNNKDIVLNTQKRIVYLFKEYGDVSENIDFVSNKVDELIK